MEIICRKNCVIYRLDASEKGGNLRIGKTKSIKINLIYLCLSFSGVKKNPKICLSKNVIKTRPDKASYTFEIHVFPIDRAPIAGIIGICPEISPKNVGIIYFLEQRAKGEFMYMGEMRYIGKRFPSNFSDIQPSSRSLSEHEYAKRIG